MKLLLKIMILFLFTSCSFNSSSSFWTEKNEKKISFKNKLNKILLKSNDIMSMTFDEYKIYLDDYNKKSDYPNINK